MRSRSGPAVGVGSSSLAPAGGSVTSAGPSIGLSRALRSAQRARLPLPGGVLKTTTRPRERYRFSG